MNKLRIFLADDHAVVREGLKTLINGQPDMQVIGEADDGTYVVPLVQACRPDLVIMDISMPGMNGIQATAELKRVYPDIHVLALSIHEDTSYLREMMENRASGYVLKRAAADALIQAVRTVAAGGVYLDAGLATSVLRTFDAPPAHPDEQQAASLSEREADVVRQIAQGYTNKEIAAQLNVSIKTVETYKARAMDKLGLTSRVAIVRYAVRRGWLQ